MIWNSGAFAIYKDKVIQETFFAKAYSGKEIISNYRANERRIEPGGTPGLSWKLSKDISEHPQYHSDYPLMEALYNLSLEEMEENIEPDHTFRTGAEWVGVWTRDISYSAILSLAILQPKICRISLMRKVQNKRIVQDTGTGGAYPVSTDRVVWGIAAWEIYMVTGDRDWLASSYEILKNSIEDDLVNAYNPKTGLYKGESSFLDWREQTYPRWMQPVDIYESESLGTNAVHYQALVVLAKMAKILKEEKAATKYSKAAEQLKHAINTHLWSSENKYYGQYLYGRKHKVLSTRADALGEALCVLFGIADPQRQQLIIENTPVTGFGIPSIFPQIPGIPSYHNNSIWPFVQSYWTLAAAKTKNNNALMESLSALFRSTALFLTNKENFEASSGDAQGTEFNSDRQLWSVAGTLAIFYKVIFGIEFKKDKLIFNPNVPKVLQGRHILNNFKYRDAVLHIEVEGFGSSVKEIRMDGSVLEHADIPADLTGVHEIILVLDEDDDGGTINKTKICFSPKIPEVVYSEGNLRWDQVENARHYLVLKNGEVQNQIANNEIKVDGKEYAEYQVIAVDLEGVPSFASEPIAIGLEEAKLVYEIEHQVPNANHPFAGYSGSGFVETNKSINTSIQIDIEIEKSSLYALDFRYSNGNGPINTDNKCAIRTLWLGNKRLGTIVLPQRGANEWSNWGYSNALIAQIDEGAHALYLTLESENENMNPEVNEAMLDYLRIVKIDG